MINHQKAKEYLEKDYTWWYENYFIFQININDEDSFNGAFEKHPLEWLLKEDSSSK
jgi:hypothetical protein